MHSEIEAALNNSDQEFLVPNVTLQNAEKLLHYIEDLNLERSGIFELTAAESLYLLWVVADWELNIECLKNGRILFTFRKGRIAKACGTFSIDEFIPYLEDYLLMDIC
ncbi:MAG: hypothetical protein JWQ84_2815 [Mucilaginibacter sp.]|nr:hypothetical protein [Mucilaginibacter sp.]